MNSSATTFATWITLAGLLLAFTGVASHSATAQQIAAQKLISYEHPYNQQPSANPANIGLPDISPELRADMLAARQHYMEALEAYRKIEPKTPDIYNKMGMAYQHLGMRNEAISCYRRSLSMNHRFAAAYNNLGTVYYHDKDNRQAERLYRKAIKLNPETAAFWSNIGATYLATRKFRDGAEAYEKALALDSSIFQEIALNGIPQFSSNEDMQKMDYCFAEVYAQAGMKDLAVEYLRKAILAGFHDKQSLQQDQQFASLHGNPQFEQLFAGQPKP